MRIGRHLFFPRRMTCVNGAFLPDLLKLESRDVNKVTGKSH